MIALLLLLAVAAALPACQQVQRSDTRPQLLASAVAAAEDAYMAAWHDDEQFATLSPDGCALPVAHAVDVAEAMAASNFSRALSQLQAAFSAQWATGMLPTEAYPQRVGRCDLAALRWRSDLSPDAPALSTSAAMALPTQAPALYRMWQRAETDEQREAVAAFFPQLLAWHAYLHQDRSRSEQMTGMDALVYIQHPDESGMPLLPQWAAMARQIGDASARGDGRDDAAAVAALSTTLQTMYSRFNYDGLLIFQHSPFLIFDAGVNALLCQADRALLAWADAMALDWSAVASPAATRQQIVEWKDGLCSALALLATGNSTYTSINLRSLQPVNASHNALTALLPAAALHAQLSADDVDALLRPYVPPAAEQTGLPLSTLAVQAAGWKSDGKWSGAASPALTMTVLRALPSTNSTLAAATARQLLCKTAISMDDAYDVSTAHALPSSTAGYLPSAAVLTAIASAPDDFLPAAHAPPPPPPPQPQPQPQPQPSKPDDAASNKTDASASSKHGKHVGSEKITQQAGSSVGLIIALVAVAIVVVAGIATAVVRARSVSPYHIVSSGISLGPVGV